MRYHLTESYLLNPTHRVTVNLVGCGGTGSQVLSGLARLNESLIGLGHPGMLVTVWDDDVVTESNVGRQLFSPADIGLNKAAISVTRVNRFFGYDWIAVPKKYSPTKSEKSQANITITCVDTIEARLRVRTTFKNVKDIEPNERALYWMDFGNSQKTGQVILGTTAPITNKDKSHVPVLPDVFDKFPQLRRRKDKDTGPSCSLAQALGKQDLFINSTLAQLGLNILWKMFREGRLAYHGAFLNLDTMNVNPVKI